MFLLFVFTQKIVAQVANSKADEIARFQERQSSVTKTLVINTINYSTNTIREFKKELNGWSEKIVSSNIDTIAKTFTFTHNGLLHPQEFEEFLRKYNIKGSSIISYN